MKLLLPHHLPQTPQGRTNSWGAGEGDGLWLKSTERPCNLTKVTQPSTSRAITQTPRGLSLSLLLFAAHCPCLTEEGHSQAAALCSELTWGIRNTVGYWGVDQWSCSCEERGIKNFFYLFIFGCAGSLLLHQLFSSVGEPWLFASCGAQASHRDGYRCCRTWALECGLSSCGTMGLVTTPRHVGSSRIKDQTWVPCLGRWILYYWAIRGVREGHFDRGNVTQPKQRVLILTSRCCA